MSAANVLVLVENCSVPRDARVWWECQVLTRAGYEVTVVCPRGQDYDQAAFELREGVAIHRFPVAVKAQGVRGHLSEYAQAAWGMAMTVRRLARRQRFDIVHVCNPPDFLILTALPERLRGARFIFDHHDLSPEMYQNLYGAESRLLHGAVRALERLTFALAHVVVSTNESYRLVALGRGRKDPKDVFVVRNAPDVVRFRPEPPDPALKRGATHLIGYVGVIGRQDGVDDALRALAALRGRRRDWRAVFMGSGPALGEARSLAGRLGLEDVVEFPGFVEDEYVVRALASSDVCLSPEPLTPFTDVSTWIKIGEYMAMAKPIVCYDLAESRLTAQDAACYARPGDVESFADCISSLLDDPDRRAAMGARGRARIEGELSREHSERALLAAYERALDLKGSHRRTAVTAS